MSILDDYQDQLPEGALRQVGAHYLWGAAGHMPEATSGILTGSANAARFANRVNMRPNTVDRRNPYLFTATCDSGTAHSCNGRNMTVGARQQVNLQWLTNPASPELQTAMRNPELWLWPRVNAEPRLGGHIVWGEHCQGVVHFNCIGFINHCIWRITHAIHRPSIQQIQRWWKHRYPSDIGTPFSLPYQTGDILIGPGMEHIVFVVRGTKVHAKSTHFGVVQEPLGASAGALHVRPTLEFLTALWF